MRGIAFLAIASVFALAVNAGDSGNPMCAQGPGYWCSSTLAAGQCGAQEYCRQLRLRSGPAAAAAAVAQSKKLQSSLGDSMCDTCQQVLSTIKQALLEGKTQAAIGQTVKSQVCARLGPLVEDCGLLVDMFLPEVLATVSMDIQPQLICTLMGMCNQTAANLSQPTRLNHTGPGGVAAAKKHSNHPVLQLMQLMKMSPAQKPLASVNCRLCRAVVAEARRLRRDRASQTEAEVAALLRDAACRVAQLASGEKSNQCTKLTSQYTPVIYHLLSTDLDDVTVCQLLGSGPCAAISASSAAAASAPPVRSSAPQPQPARWAQAIASMQISGGSRQEEDRL